MYESLSLLCLWRPPTGRAETRRSVQGIISVDPIFRQIVGQRPLADPHQFSGILFHAPRARKIQRFSRSVDRSILPSAVAPTPPIRDFPSDSLQTSLRVFAPNRSTTRAACSQ